ncbi:hypothetical protein MSL71_10030 [Desulfoluna butyratoxydans]|uniref:Uncharacterized protein n=1 Tax=Desulfoluna butyratoxydans TaxID=231438 RepID=A0A4U8YI80_9BACT|nr:hypothetical protein MSL71_10030 [Desulfoluna butyratoxydans]
MTGSADTALRKEATQPIPILTNHPKCTGGRRIGKVHVCPGLSGFSHVLFIFRFEHDQNG